MAGSLDELVISLEPHPTLRAAAFATAFPQPLGELDPPVSMGGLLSGGSGAPMRRDEDHRAAVRGMLRHGGYKPTGRGKPASEYLVRAAEEGALSSINLAVDACNIVSLHSGVPISVVDLDRARPPFRIAIADPGDRYVFNPAGQQIELAGLVCLFDEVGPCANAVKDAQRTKTGEGTRRTLSVLWGVAGHEGRLEEATDWYREILESAGASTAAVPLLGPPGDA